MNSREYCSLVKEHSEDILNYSILASNPNINIDLCRDFYDSKHIDNSMSFNFWNCVSNNVKGISLKDIENNPDLPWNPYYVSTRKDITLEFAKKNSNLLGKNITYVYSRIGTIDDLYSIRMVDWSITLLSMNPNITKEFVNRHSDLIWYWRDILFLNESTKHHYKYFIEKYGGIKFNTIELLVSYAYIIPFEILKEYYEEIKLIPNFFRGFSLNRSISIDFIKSNIDDPWEWSNLSSNSAISKKFIDEFIDKPWHFGNLSSNPNIDLDLIKKHLDKPWVWENISKHINITFRDIYENLDLPWSMTVFSNPNIKFKHLDKLAFPRSEYHRYAYNPNLTLRDIQLNPDINFICFGLFNNYFKYDKNLQLVAKRTIIRYYRKYKLIYRLKHLAKQSYLVDELKYMPKLGVKYYETMEEISIIIESTNSFQSK
jgi:hypothetical protein